MLDRVTRVTSNGACRRRFDLVEAPSSGSCLGSSTKVAKRQRRVVTVPRRDAAGFFGLHDGCNDLGEGSVGAKVATQFGPRGSAGAVRRLDPSGLWGDGSTGREACRGRRIRSLRRVRPGLCFHRVEPDAVQLRAAHGPSPAPAHDSVRDPGRPPAKPPDRSIQWRVEGDCGSNSMTKAELVAQVAQDVLVTRREADRIVETVVSSIVNTLRKGEKVEIRGFGSFRTRTRKARTGRNPRSGESVYVPPKTVPFFKPSKQLRDAVLDANPTES